MANLKISPTADSDLNEISQYLAVEQDNPEAADRVIRAVMDTLLLLPNFPRLGTVCHEFSDLFPNLQSITVEGYLLYYRRNEEMIDVIRIVSSRRERRRALED